MKRASYLLLAALGCVGVVAMAACGSSNDNGASSTSSSGGSSSGESSSGNMDAGQDGGVANFPQYVKDLIVNHTADNEVARIQAEYEVPADSEDATVFDTTFFQ
jgi:hypothetical protein